MVFFSMYCNLNNTYLAKMYFGLFEYQSQKLEQSNEQNFVEKEWDTLIALNITVIYHTLTTDVPCTAR